MVIAPGPYQIELGLANRIVSTEGKMLAEFPSYLPSNCPQARLLTASFEMFEACNLALQELDPTGEIRKHGQSAAINKLANVISYINTQVEGT